MKVTLGQLEEPTAAWALPLGKGRFLWLIINGASPYSQPMHE
jgi:hypothetical protein